MLRRCRCLLACISQPPCVGEKHFEAYYPLDYDTAALSAGVAVLHMLKGDPQCSGNREDWPLFRDPLTGLELTCDYAADRLKALLFRIGAADLAAGMLAPPLLRLRPPISSMIVRLALAAPRRRRGGCQ
jgi:hypothetical protein